MPEEGASLSRVGLRNLKLQVYLGRTNNGRHGGVLRALQRSGKPPRGANRSDFVCSMTADNRPTLEDSLFLALYLHFIKSPGMARLSWRKL
ncbi:hypothetical protein JOQ06_004967 [Pogonophryne albipinna]|uniref:Uncharacterized protein n=1 Tax=Pogonophryne albipinna TaxID=1090488 RepID=A0AAD6AQI1_9TELE|nr:hypothetical protein JOQ06_004967 [Pogonophryne albipinna]